MLVSLAVMIAKGSRRLIRSAGTTGMTSSSATLRCTMHADVGVRRVAILLGWSPRFMGMSAQVIGVSSRQTGLRCRPKLLVVHCMPQRRAGSSAGEC